MNVSRKMKRVGGSVAAAIILAVAACFAPQRGGEGWRTSQSSPAPQSVETVARNKRPVRYERVVDGDTIIVREGSKRLRVRLLSIDAPESEPNNRALRMVERRNVPLKRQLAQGKRATERLREMLSSAELLYLQHDAEREDNYGRTLAYVFLADGSMINEELLREGLVYLAIYSTNKLYAARLRAAEAAAKREGLGVWSRSR